MTALGPTEIIIILIFFLNIVLPVVALVDAARQPDGALAGGRGLWIALLAVSLLIPLLGAVLSLVYLLAVRPRRR